MKKLCGIDEAGRGCLAGDLVVAGCVLTEDIQGLNDSKKLSEKRREELYEVLFDHSLHKIISFSSADVDEKGLSWCLKTALMQIREHFRNYDILYDGNTNFGVQSIKTLVKADASVAEVAAASILAKVTRDKAIKEYAKAYPNYGFESNKGYGSKTHIEAIKKHGLSPIHRKSYKIKSLQKSLF